MALFVIQYSLAKYLMELGVKPNGLIGHRGVYNMLYFWSNGFVQTIQTIDKRAICLLNGPEGNMIYVSSSEDILKQKEFQDVYLSIINSPNDRVYSGKPEAMREFEEWLIEKGINYKVLSTIHPNHSPLLEIIRNNFKKHTDSIQYKDVQIPFVSNSSGQIINKKSQILSNYWEDHIIKPVLFEESVKTILGVFEDCLFIDFGPGNFIKNLLEKVHIDKHVSVKKKDSDQADNGINEPHPLYHLQYNLNPTKSQQPNLGDLFYIDTPRILHKPLDFILGISFLTSNFYPTAFEILKEENVFRRLHKDYSKAIWKPFFHTLANQWKPFVEADIVWNPIDDICPIFV